MKIRKNSIKNPITDNISTTICFGILLEKQDIKKDHIDKTRTHNKIDPSWDPQTADILYMLSNEILELLATYFSEKSSTKKA